MRVVFDVIDANGDGSICVSELRNLIEKTGQSVTEEELEALVWKKFQESIKTRLFFNF